MYSKQYSLLPTLQRKEKKIKELKNKTHYGKTLLEKCWKQENVALLGYRFHRTAVKLHEM